MYLELVKDLSLLVNAVGAGNCFLLSYVYLRKNDKQLQQSGAILSLLFFILGAIIINTIFNFTGYSKYFYEFEPLTNAFIFAIAPLLFLYMRSQSSRRHIGIWSVHLALFYTILVLNIITIWIPDTTAFANIWSMFHTSEFMRILWNVHFLGYLIVIVMKYRKMNKDHLRKTGILIFSIASIWFFNLLFYLYSMLVKPLPILVHLNITLLFSGMTLLLFYQKLKAPEIRIKRTMLKRKAKKLSSLNTGNDSIIVNIQEKKYYRDANLDIRTLSNELQLPYHELSIRINQQYNQNFNEFINSFRIQEVVFAIETQQHESYTIMGLAQRAGFKSASVFYAAFKKEKGITPTQYIKQITRAS